MPAKSKKQQAFMAIAEHHPEQLRGPMPDMSRSQLHDFAATPTSGLPQQAPAQRKRSKALDRMAAGQR